jgi:hypothetical protein
MKSGTSPTLASSAELVSITASMRLSIEAASASEARALHCCVEELLRVNL